MEYYCHQEGDVSITALHSATVKTALIGKPK